MGKKSSIKSALFLIRNAPNSFLLTSLSDTEHNLWDGSSLTKIGLEGWRKYLEEYSVTEDQYLRKLAELKRNEEYPNPSHEAIWQLIYEFNLIAHHNNDNLLMERTYRTMAVMTYDLGEDPSDMVEMSMQYRLIQLDTASMNRTKYSRVEVLPGCKDCFASKIVLDISIARALIPVPSKECKNRTDKSHPYGLCECIWQPSFD